MQATLHTKIQLTSTTSKNELSMPPVAHLTLKSGPISTSNFLKLSLAMMIALISVPKLLSHLGDALLTLCRTNIWRSSSINNLLCPGDQILFNPQIAATLAWSCPFDTISVAKLSTTPATLISLASMSIAVLAENTRHMVATPFNCNERAAREASPPIICSRSCS